jgi:hypothetical protein
MQKDPHRCCDTLYMALLAGKLDGTIHFSVQTIAGSVRTPQARAKIDDHMIGDKCPITAIGGY